MRTFNILIIIILSITSYSCFTVKYSTSGASIPPEAKTFSVDYFTNKAPIAPADLGQKLTESLKDKFIDNTRLSLVSRNGDLLFEGEIISYDIKPVNIQSDDQAGNMRLTMQVKVTFVNMKAHEWDYSTSFSQYIDMGADQLEPTSTQIEELNDKIIDEIFNKSVANW